MSFGETTYQLKKKESDDNINSFENLYLRVREKEGRLYNDEEISTLPLIATNHPHYKEWKIRKRSYRRFFHYLKNLNWKLDILELGCGNGWLSSKLADGLSGTVTGIDINKPELEQAQRVFGEKENLRFLYGDIQNGVLNHQRFDVIVFSASIQYFPSLIEILEIASKHLNQNGEIHILDSHFYKKEELLAAKERTKNYYEALGFPEMSDFYFHHCFSGLNSFNHKILFDPNSFTSKFLRPKNPFYWIRITKS